MKNLIENGNRAEVYRKKETSMFVVTVRVGQATGLGQQKKKKKKRER